MKMTWEVGDVVRHRTDLDSNLDNKYWFSKPYWGEKGVISGLTFTYSGNPDYYYKLTFLDGQSLYYHNTDLSSIFFSEDP